MSRALILFGDFALAAVVVAATNWVALIPFRRAKEQHWTERARKLFPARASAASNLWTVPGILALGEHLWWPAQTPHWIFIALAAWFGALVGTYPFDHEVFPWLRARDWLHQALSAWLIRLGWLFLFFGILFLMPDILEWRTWALAGLLIAAWAVWIYGGVVRCWKALRLLKPKSERLNRIVAGVSQNMNIPVRGIWILKSSASMAYALPYTGDLVFSERFLEAHPDDEIASVCAHELGHLGENRRMLLMRLMSGLVYFPWIFFKPLLHALGEWTYAFLSLFLSSYLMFKPSRKVSVRLEVRADRLAQSYDARDGTFARALEKVCQENLIPAVQKKRSKTHPDLYDRLLAAGVQPDYPRPAPPRSLTLAGLFLAMLFGGLVGYGAVSHLDRHSVPSQKSGAVDTRER